MVSLALAASAILRMWVGFEVTTASSRRIGSLDDRHVDDVVMSAPASTPTAFACSSVRGTVVHRARKRARLA